MQKRGYLNRWDERYSEHDWFYGTEPNDFLVSRIMAFKPGGLILSVGEGEGRNALYLLENGFSVFAIDLSSVGLEKLKKEAEKRGFADRLQTEVVDVKDFQFSANHFDGAIAIWCHLSPITRVHFLRSMCKAIKDGGVLLIEGYREKQLEYKTGGPPTLDLMFSMADFLDNLADFNALVIEEKEREIHEGQGHNGQSAVVQYLGRRKARRLQV